jgi:2-methylisocitrate lyase-like PEP mutase family enzyme
MIVDASGKPLIADADTGYGEPVQIRRTVAEFARAGAAAIHLEDQILPKRCSFLEGMQIAPTEVMIQRIRAATDTVSELGSDMLIIARTDSAETDGLGEAIRRAERYVRAGADAIFIQGVANRDELAQIGDSLNVPLLVNMAAGMGNPDYTLEELEELGFSIVIRPVSALFLVHRLLADFYDHLKANGAVGPWTNRMTTMKDFNQSIGVPELAALERKYATAVDN